MVSEFRHVRWNKEYERVCGVGLRHTLVYKYVRRGICKVLVFSPLLPLLLLLLLCNCCCMNHCETYRGRNAATAHPP